MRKSEPGSKSARARSGRAQETVYEDGSSTVKNGLRAGRRGMDDRVKRLKIKRKPIKRPKPSGRAQTAGPSRMRKP